VAAQHFGDDLTRYAMQVRVRYRRVVERTYRPERGCTRDLNAQGAWVELPEQVAAQSTLAIALDTPEGDLPLVAHVAWTSPELPAAPYLHGLRFTGVTPDRRERLRTLLARAKPPVAARLYCALTATCQRKGVGYAVVPGAIRDLGDSGVGVRLLERMPPGTEVRISASTRYGQIAAETQVVWADPPGRLPPGASYRHGLRFLRLAPLSELPLRVLLEGLR